LAIYNAHFKERDFTRLITLQKQKGFSSGYLRREFQIPNGEDIEMVIGSWIFSVNSQENAQQESSKDSITEFLICTHGSIDKCCAKYGTSLYQNALKIAAKQLPDNVRIWQASHFGGHRFAPTAIAFPEGRYYGRLDLRSLVSLLTRTGDIHHHQKTYRGWGILPYPVQALERELMMRHGWDWFDCRVSYQILYQGEDKKFTQVKMVCQTPSGLTEYYQADVIEDEAKTLYLKGECGNAELVRHGQFTVQNLTELSVELPCS